MILPIRQFQAQYLKAPRDFKGIVSSEIALEIGAGKGKHALQYAAQHPQSTLYAVERTREKFQMMQRLHAESHLANLHPIHADVLPWVVHALYPAQVRDCFILYPNPEPHNPAQRWLNMPFFEFLLSRMATGGQITLASNIPGYIAEAEQQLQKVWQLPYEKSAIVAHSARTHFEMKYLGRGEVCQELVVQKPAGYSTRFDGFLPLQGQLSISPAHTVDAEHVG